jgi:hypothetical protein
MGLGLVTTLLLVDRLPARLDLVFVVAATLLAEQVMVLEPGMPWGHDTRVHAWATAAWTRELLAGTPFPFWLHELGAGVPLGQFYPPLGFAAMVPLHAFGLDLPTAFRLTFVLFAVLGAVGVWRLVRDVTPDRRAALVAAAAFAFAPYRLYDVHVRSALGQAAATAVLPYLLRALGRALRRGGGVRRLALVAGTMLIAHLLTVVLVVYGVLAWLAGVAMAGRRSLRRRWRPVTMRLGLAALLGAALAAFYLVPLLADVAGTSVERILPKAGTFLLPGIDGYDLLGWRPPLRSSSQHQRLVPVPVGAVFLAGLAIAAVRLRRVSPRLRGALCGALATAAFGLFLGSGAGSPIGAHLPAIRVLQFPWRALTLTVVAGSAALGWALARWPGRRGAWVGACVLAALIAEGRLYAGVPSWVEPWDGVARLTAIPEQPGRLRAVRMPSPPRRLVGGVLPPSRPEARLPSGLATAFLEYSNPRAYALQPRAWGKLGVALLVRRDGSVQKLRVRSYSSWRGAGGERRHVGARVGHGRIRVEAPAAGTVGVREQCFPGWRERRGEIWIEAGCDREGFLTATVDDPAVVEWRFDGWRAPRVAGSAISAAALLVLLAPSARGLRRLAMRR